MGPVKFIKSGDSNWLFDLSDDLGEKQNLRDSETDALRKLETLLDEWRSE